MKIDVCVVGELNLDIVLYGLPKDLVMERELLATGTAITLGSSSAIFAHNLSMLGTKVGFMSKIGKDPLGQIALERLAASGVEVTQVKKTNTATSTGLSVILPNRTQRYILTYPGTMSELVYADLDLNYLRSARHLHISSFYLQNGLRPRVVDLFREAKARGMSTSLDTNDDPSDRWDRDVLEVLKYVDLFFPNDREVKKIAHNADLSSALNTLCKLAKVVVVKRGASAAICRSGDEQWSLAPPPVQKVDDIGAGDTFAAGFIHRYLQNASLESCLAYANAAGAYSATREGGTEAFRDRVQMRAFFQLHEKSFPK
jgi:sugar/nucleoside kinase (ribokinase family)